MPKLGYFAEWYEHRHKSFAAITHTEQCTRTSFLTVELQMTGALWFSFSDAQFSLSYSSVCTHVSLPPPFSLPLSASLPADMVKINGSSILCKVWCLPMKSYLLWVMHLMAAGTTAGCTTNSSQTASYSNHKNTNMRAQAPVHPCMHTFMGTFIHANINVLCA